MKEKIEQVNESVERRSTGNTPEDVQVLQCVKTSDDAETHLQRDNEQEQKLDELADSGSSYSLSSLLSLPLSKIGVETQNSGAQLSHLPSAPPLVPNTSSTFGSPESIYAQDGCMPESNQRFFLGFPPHLSGILEQRAQNAPYFHQNSAARCLAQQFVNFRDPQYLNIPGMKAKSEDSEEAVLSEIPAEVDIDDTSPGEINLGTRTHENSRKRRKGEDEPRKTALQRKMEHLDKEKERRLRQTKCYELLRNLVPLNELKTDKANVLEATVAYLRYIKRTFGPRMTAIDKGFLEDFKRKSNASS